MGEGYSVESKAHGELRVGVISILVLCVGLPLLSAGIGLGIQSPWVDEIFTLGAASKGTPWMSAYIGMSSHTMPLYPFVVWFFSLGGSSLVGARLLSFLAFVLASYFFLRASTRLFDAKTAKWATACFALHPLLVWHAQDARMYMLGLMFAMGAFWFLLETLETGKRGYTIALGVSAFLGMLNHLYFALFAAPMVLMLVWYRKDAHRVRAFITLAVAGAAAVPVMVTMILMQDAFPGEAKPLNVVAAMGYSALTLAGGYAIGASKEDLHGAQAMEAMRPYLPMVAAIILAFWIPVLIGAIAMWRKDWRKAAMLIPIPIFCVLITYILAITTGKVSFNVRYTLAAVPAVILPIAYLVSRSRSPLRWGAFALAIGAEIFGLTSWYVVERHWNEDYRRLTAFLMKECDAGDLLYSNPVGPVQIALETEGYERDVVYLTLDSFDESMELKQARRFYVINRPWRADPSNRMRSRLDKSPGVERHEFRGFLVYFLPAGESAPTTGTPVGSS